MLKTLATQLICKRPFVCGWDWYGCISCGYFLLSSENIFKLIVASWNKVSVRTHRICRWNWVEKLVLCAKAKHLLESVDATQIWNIYGWLRLSQKAITGTKGNSEFHLDSYERWYFVIPKYLRYELLDPYRSTKRLEPTTNLLRRLLIYTVLNT